MFHVVRCSKLHEIMAGVLKQEEEEGEEGRRGGFMS